MRIGVYIGGEVLGQQADLERLLREAREAEERGFASAWVPHIFGADAIGALAIAGRETRRIELGTAVIPTFTRHPFSLAQQALTVQAASRGRFTLGIGPSHRFIVEGMLGLPYEKPARHTREYLSVLIPLLERGSVTYRGEVYRVNGELRFPVEDRVPVLVGALGPAMLRLAGRSAAGTVTWMAGPRALEAHVVPSVRAAAEEAGRPEPRIVAGFPISVTHAPDRGREMAGRIFRGYGRVPAYRAMLEREGVAGPADVALVGDAATVEAELRRLADTGVTELMAAPFPADEGATERTLDFLAAFP
ncbi:MAG: TIGR03564 family F420-dependent LLM class oxidoreductase [Actinomycetota bacterium]|nr:TIGR03564 family F420-dependent LLM class oxidoreductase [Actinomycetota bacterium]